jgi:SAM-dependent methyltransferase
MSGEMLPFESRAQWLDWQELHRRELALQHTALVRLKNTIGSESLAGYCALCDAQRAFQCAAIGDEPVSFRESLLCAVCHANARQRATAQVLRRSVELARSRIYLTEQASHFYLGLKSRCRSLRGSEFTTSLMQRIYLWLWLARKGRPGWLHREDVTCLSLRSRSVDAVVSLDVLEHVPDVDRALVEFARVLRPGGQLVFTVPFYAAQKGSEQLALLSAEGTIQHLQTPEYHGDPLGSGVLCFHHFGWDLLARVRDAGFAQAVALRVRDPDSALPEAQWVLRATR